MLKQCRKCENIMERTEFYKDRKMKDGLSSHCKVCRNAAMKTPAGRKITAKYRTSDKGRAKDLRYAQSDEGKEVIAKSKAKYRATDLGKATEKAHRIRYEASAEGKAVRKKWNESEGGKASIKVSQDKYNGSESGKENRKRYQESVGCAESRQNYKDSHGQEIAARRYLNNSVRDGYVPHVTTLKCSNCGKQAQEYHHYLGYEEKNWLDVIPLCRVCHKLED